LLDPEVFKKLADTDIWEFRTLFNKKKYRVLAFWDKEGPVDTLVIATHGFVKKTQKTPQREVNKAISIRELYFKNKQNNKTKQEELCGTKAKQGLSSCKRMAATKW
jgi:phage-related protein